MLRGHMALASRLCMSSQKFEAFAGSSTVGGNDYRVEVNWVLRMWTTRAWWAVHPNNALHAWGVVEKRSLGEASLLCPQSRFCHESCALADRSCFMAKCGPPFA